jgi:hypothetical protein
MLSSLSEKDVKKNFGIDYDNAKVIINRQVTL